MDPPNTSTGICLPSSALSRRLIGRPSTNTVASEDGMFPLDKASVSRRVQSRRYCCMYSVTALFFSSDHSVAYVATAPTNQKASRDNTYFLALATRQCNSLGP